MMIQPPYPSRVPLRKGALVALRETLTTLRIIGFQYNPETLTRELAPREVGGTGGGRTREIYYAGAADETISIDVHLESIPPSDPIAAMEGVYPQIAALQLLLYPSTAVVTEANLELEAGSIEFSQSPVPTVLFVWGSQRCLPVRMQSMTVVEEMFDADLKPIRATLSLRMKVVSYSDVTPSDPAFDLSLAQQKRMELLALAAQATKSNIIAIESNLP